MAVWFSGIRLDATGWIDHLELVEFLAMTGCILGLIIGRSRLSAGLAKVIGLGYSIVILPWQLSLAAPLEKEYAERLADVVGRMYTSIVQFAGNQRLDDPIFFLACISLLYWSYSLIAGYLLARYGRPWYPLAAAGAVIVMIEFYHAPGALGWESGAFAISLLLLAGRLHFVRLKKIWQKNNLAVDAETGMGMGKAALAVSILVVLISWNLPIFTPAIWKQVLASSPDLLTPLSWQERLSNIVAAVNQSASPEGDNFGGLLELGHAATTGRNVIFTASIIESDGPPARYYWRARTYDFYNNGSWVNTQDNSMDLAAGEDRFLANETPFRRENLIQFVISTSNLHNLFTAGDPRSVSLPVKVTGEIIPEGIVDVNLMTAHENLLRGASYRQVSRVANPSGQFLRGTSQDYPAWVRARYLQLPAGLTQRTKDLAVEITAGKATPYDQAEAITAWLRREIAYENSVPDPPANREAVDWFLFDHKAGYCNFYATAEVILLRSLGIPARMAVGYAQGEMDPETGRFLVLRKDSHAWPEVYFPGIGWVEFEPTASQPDLEYREMDSFGEAPNQDPPDDEFDRIRDPEEGGMEAPIPDEMGAGQQRSNLADFWEKSKAGIIFLLALLTAGGIGYLLKRICVRRNTSLPALAAGFLTRMGLRVPAWLKFLAYYFSLSVVGRSFIFVPVYIRVLGGIWPPGATPAESIDLLNHLEPATTYYSRILLSEFEKETFSRQPADLETGSAAAGALAGQIFQTLWQRLLRW
jgi:transglutaminase-like putative cysteine protease